MFPSLNPSVPALKFAIAALWFSSTATTTRASISFAFSASPGSAAASGTPANKKNIAANRRTGLSPHFGTNDTLASDRVRPAFREGQRRCREGTTLALALPGLPLGLDAVADEARAERRYQYSAYAVAAVGDLVRLGVDEERLADIEPGERDVFA